MSDITVPWTLVSTLPPDHQVVFLYEQTEDDQGLPRYTHLDRGYVDQGEWFYEDGEPVRYSTVLAWNPARKASECSLAVPGYGTIGGAR
jgi:hypothetical protein